jgi:LysM repeat protein
VKRGDTLSSIAKKFKTDARSISYWNRARYKSLDPEAARYAPDKIKVGWELQVMAGQKYVPPEDDGESGELYTPPPEDLDPEESDASTPPSPSASPAP